MPKYDFKFTPEFAGQSVTVTNSNGTEVEGSPATLGNAGMVQLDLDGDENEVYTGVTSNTNLGLGNVRSTGVLNVFDSFGAGGAADLACTYVVSLGANVIPVGTPTTITFAESADYALRDDQFTLDGDTLTCIQAGEYRIDAYASPSLSGGGTVDTAGPVEIEAFVSINDENAGPAWNYYPRVLAWVVGTAGVATISFSFPQPLAEGDEIQLCARPILRGTTDLGELVFSVGTTAALMFTKIG